MASSEQASLDNFPPYLSVFLEPRKPGIGRGWPHWDLFKDNNYLGIVCYNVCFQKEKKTKAMLNVLNVVSILI